MEASGVRCRICEGDAVRFVRWVHGEYRHDDVALFRCEGCESWMTTPEAPERAEDLGQVNSVAWHLSGLEYNQRKVRALFARIEERGWVRREGRRFLDIGCALGHAVAEAGRWGYEAMGVEPEETAAEYAERVTRVRVERGFFTRSRPGGAAFDVISLDNVLEHVEAPHELMGDIAARLTAGGVLFLGVPPVDWARRWTSVSLLAPAGKPARDWRGEMSGNRWLAPLSWRDTFGFPNGHINYFSARGIGVLAERHGLRVEEQFHAQGWRPGVYRWLGLTTGFWLLRKRA
jgi:SAM-dependent methyltransferase